MSNCCHCHQPCGRPHLSCDSCKAPVHNKCLDLTEAELRVITSTKSTNLKILCNQCKNYNKFFATNEKYGFRTTVIS